MFCCLIVKLSSKMKIGFASEYFLVPEKRKAFKPSQCTYGVKLVPRKYLILTDAKLAKRFISCKHQQQQQQQ